MYNCDVDLEMVTRRHVQHSHTQGIPNPGICERLAGLESASIAAHKLAATHLIHDLQLVCAHLHQPVQHTVLPAECRA